jgi:S-adenosylmethionine hydrolase
MTPFERRLCALEATRSIIFHGRDVLVIFDADEARIHAGAVRHERARISDETPDDFERRVAIEAGRFGSRLITMTRQKFDEIAARLEEGI